MISIIVPLYNAAEYIEKTIETVVFQTYTDWELILVDDRSRDNSVEAAKACIAGLEADIAAKISLIEKKENEGAAMARNTGLDASKGRYIAFLDADDLWQSDKLSKQIELMKETGAAFSFTGYEFADENGRGLGKIVRVPATITYEQALKNTTIFTSTVMIDTDRISREEIMMPYVKSEDTASWWKVLRSGYIGYGLDESLTLYRRMPGTLSADKVEAVRRIWNLYRNVEGKSVPESAYLFCHWAVRAVLRRV